MRFLFSKAYIDDHMESESEWDGGRQGDVKCQWFTLYKIPKEYYKKSIMILSSNVRKILGWCLLDRHQKSGEERPAKNANLSFYS